MSETLEEFIARRLPELDEAEKPFLVELAAIRLERQQLKRASLAAGFAAKSLAEPDRPRKTRKAQTGTIKEAIVAILAEASMGMTALDLLDKLNARNNSSLLRSSLSPQLSRLKLEGHIMLTNKLWHLPDQKIEPSGNNLFDEGLSEGSNPETLAKDREAGSGGGI